MRRVPKATCGLWSLVAVWLGSTDQAVAEQADRSAGLIAVATHDATVASSSKPETYETLTLVLGGDIGLNGSGQPVLPTAALRHGDRRSWSDLTAGLRPLLAGDAVFANLETVVTDRSDLAPLEKAFNFRSHPLGVKHLVETGFNLFSIANNHAIDYGDAGLRETIKHISALRADGLAAAGLGLGRAAALAPSDSTIKGARIRMSALGIGVGSQPAHASPERATMASYGSDTDFREAVTRLGSAEADIRILSVHYGQEMQVRPSQADEKRLREAVMTHNIDIVAGHHAHVVAGVQQIDGRLIFFGLGNLMHPGMQDMARHGICRDYGLLARVHLARTPGDRFKVHAIEAIALRDMHATVRARDGEDGATRIAVLNHLAAGLDQSAPGGARGIRFTPQANGRGLYCSADAERMPGSIGALCAQGRKTANRRGDICRNKGAQLIYI